jgi:methionyl-tRNA formyltransferase
MLLRHHFEVVATVIEPSTDQRRALRRRGKWTDALAAEYHLARRTVLGLNRYRRRFFADATLRAELSAIPVMNVLSVASINDPSVIDFVADSSPDICVITCVTILSKATIDALGVKIINIHGGHLPHYRGCHCFFFALYEGNFDQIGSTIHYVDAGIDTGDIIEVVRPAIRADDNAEKLYCRAELAAAHRLIHWLKQLSKGESVPSERQAFRGRLCLRRHRLPHHDIAFVIRRLTGRLSFPSVGEFERWRRPDEVSVAE